MFLQLIRLIYKEHFQFAFFQLIICSDSLESDLPRYTTGRQI